MLGILTHEEFRGKLYPSGKFGICKQRKMAVEPVRARGKSRAEQWNSDMLSVHGVERSLEYVRKGRPVQKMSSENNPVDSPEPLGSSMRSNSHKRVRRGSKGISKAGRRAVENSAILLESTYGRSRISFLTLTIPGVTEDEAIALSGNWSEIVRVFLQWLCRRLKNAGLPDCVVSVTEVQEGRLRGSGVLGLHLHMLFVGRKAVGGWLFSPEDIREAWRRAVGNHLSMPPEFYDWRAVERLERIKKSASGYIGKYMSKGLKSAQLISEVRPDVVLPSTWYNLSQSMRRWYKKSVVILSRELAGYIVELIENKEEECFEFVGSVSVSYRDRQIKVGYCGKMTTSMIYAVKEWKNATRPRM